MKKIYQDTTFYLIVFILTYFIYIYPFEILNEFLFDDRIDRKTSFIYTFCISILVIFYFRSKNTFAPLKLFIYEGMGIGFISFWIINFALIISFFDIVSNKILGLLSLFIIFFISLIGLIFGRIIFIKKLNFKTKKINKDFKFIFLSDVHLGTNSIYHLQKILNAINKLDYDFVLIGGDLIDSSSFNLKDLSILNKHINKPIYFVTGNHEYYINHYKEKINNLKNYNISVLHNNSVNINDINIVGIDDKQSLENQVKEFNRLKDNYKFNLLLIHKPAIWDQVKNNVDLMLSGHCHNGQIIPFNFFVRIQFKYIYGLYKHLNKSNLYVSSGSSCWGPRIRVGTKNEIVYVNISHND